MNHSELPIGTVLDGTYVLTGILGAGGMGTVYQAKHQRLPKQVAVKVLHAFVANDRDTFTRFRREAEIASEIDHPNIIRALDFNTLDDGRPYLVLEYLRGENLRDHLDGEALPLESALSITSEIASGLAAAHAGGIVHRDLKPENIFLSQSEGMATAQVKILDFGISKLLGTQSLTQDGMMIGTPYYMSPEQAQGKPVDARTDQFALAAMVYEMLAGRPPFWGDQPMQVLYQVVHQEPPPLRQLANELPQKVIETIERGLMKSPDERFTSASAFALALWQGSGLEPPRDSMLGLHPAKKSQLALDVATGPTLPPLDALTPEPLGNAPTMPSPPDASPAFAPTLDSQGALPVNPQPAPPPPEQITVAPSYQRSPKIAFMGLALLVVGGIALGVSLSIKGRDVNTATTPKLASPRAAELKDPKIERRGPSVDATTAGADTRQAQLDSGLTIASKAQRSKRTPAAKKPAKAPRRVITFTTEQRQLKARVWRLYKQRRYHAAGSLLRVLDGKLKPSQRWISDKLYTIIFCGNEDLQNAKSSFARLPKHARGEALRLCKKHGNMDPR
ncbi:MAG: serine/threonine protein kinase [Deltaproteobacteria bacterium]|nr:serine/threonine protein kinase [Deltaproteobacteria bacterium]